MGLAVRAGDAGPVHGEHNVQPVSGPIVDDLIVGALEESGVDGDNGQKPLLFNELEDAQAQVWATGLDAETFHDVPDAVFVACLDGQINNILG